MRHCDKETFKRRNPSPWPGVRRVYACHTPACTRTAPGAFVAPVTMEQSQRAYKRGERERQGVKKGTTWAACLRFGVLAVRSEPVNQLNMIRDGRKGEKLPARGPDTEGDKH